MDQLRRKVILMGVFGAAALVDAARAQAPVAPPSTVAPPPVQAPSTPPPPPSPDAKPFWAYPLWVLGQNFSGVLALAGVALGHLVGTRNTARTIEAGSRSSQAAIWQKANEAEVQAIVSKLDGFYGPFVQLSGVNYLLASDLRARLGLEAGFRLMLALCEPGWLDGLSTGDAQVVEQICANADRLESLIDDQAGAVDAILAPYLARAATHFRMLSLAGRRQLGDDPKLFERFVYPDKLDDVVEREVARLRRRLSALRASPASPAGQLEPLEIPDDLKLDSWPSVPRRSGGEAVARVE